MNKKFNLIIILLFIPFILTGCYDHKELNEIAILSATEVTKKDGQFIISAQIVNPQSKDETTTQAPFFVYTGTGKTVQDAYRQIKLQSSRFLYPKHLQILIINEKLAKEDITQIIDLFLRPPQTRSEFYILIGKDQNILNITTPIDQLSSASILETLTTNNKYLGVSNLTTFNDFTDMALNKNIEIALPSIESIDYNEKSKNVENTENTTVKNMYKLGNIAIFKDNKLITYLNQDESITYNVLKNKAQTIILNYECEKDKYVTYEATTIKSDFKYTDNKLKVNINLTGNINELMCNIDLNDKDKIKKLEKNLNKYYSNKVKKELEHIKTYNTDILGIKDSIYKHDQKTYKLIKDSWYDEYYPNIEISVKSNIKIQGKGNIMEGIHEKNK